MARTTELADGIWLTREDEHELGAFKWRGALAVLEARRPDRVVTASTGNHGAATAWAAKQLGARATVFVPDNASAAKVGGGAIGGAILGAILGGGKGAAIGGAIGAAGGSAAVMAGGRKPAQIAAGSPVTVKVLSPVTVTVERE